MHCLGLYSSLFSFWSVLSREGFQVSPSKSTYGLSWGLEAEGVEAKAALASLGLCGHPSSAERPAWPVYPDPRRPA